MRVADFLEIADRIRENYKPDDRIPAIVFEKQDIEDLFETSVLPAYELTWDRMAHISERIEDVAHISLDSELFEIMREAYEIEDDE